ncbi:MAG TPA: SGNH/GDSL hydrolase family protein [Thermoanaerobaculia bacterium]|nr:SGNH/GDSL hydrolase family protein [Thermoanaerobaculia bacterium]
MIEPKPGTSRRARWKRRIARLAVLLLVLIPTGEILVRTVEHFLGPSGSLYSLIVPRPHGRFVLRPNADLNVPERYGDIRYRLNREGYRDIDHNPESKTARRVLLLGDSVTFGLGVPQDRIYAARLQGELARRGVESPEVISLAVFAYDTLDELAAFEEDGAKYQAQTVVLQFYLNDFSVRMKVAASAAPAAPPTPTLGQRLIAVKNRVLFGSALYRRLNQLVAGVSYRLFHDLRRERYPETLNRDEIGADAAYLAKHPDDATVPTFDAIARIRRAAKAHGARFLVFLSPDEVQLFDRTFDGVTGRLLRFCAAQKIDCFDPLPAFRSRTDKTQLFLDGVHYSPHGHAVVAELLADELARRGEAK